jgi:hypothetical protein
MKRSDIYKALRDKLIAEISGVTVDIQRGQMDKPIKDYPMPMPLALIGFSRIRWEVLANELERGEMTITVDYYKNLVSSGSFSGAESEDETLDLLDSPDEIYQALGYYFADGLFEELYRVEESELKAGNCLIGYRVVFKTYVYQEDKE